MEWVTVERFGMRLPAEMCAAHLRGSGIDAHVLGDDAGGIAPHLSLGGGGVSVRVPVERLEEARLALAAMALEEEE